MSRMALSLTLEFVGISSPDASSPAKKRALPLAYSVKRSVPWFKKLCTKKHEKHACSDYFSTNIYSPVFYFPILLYDKLICSCMMKKKKNADHDTNDISL